jgi:hypothetical protein
MRRTHQLLHFLLPNLAAHSSTVKPPPKPFNRQYNFLEKIMNTLFIPTPPAMPNALTLPEEAFHANWLNGYSPYKQPLYKAPTDSEKERTLQKYVAEHTKRVSQGDPVARYLEHCGLPGPVSEELRYNPALYYSFDGLGLGMFPAMVAVLRGPRSHIVKLNFTFLTLDGRLAAVPHPRILVDKRVNSLKACLMLHEPRDGVIGIALSLEAAQAVYLDYGVPTVAAITYQNLANFTAPKEVRHIKIFANNTLAGLDSALVLSDRAQAAGLTVKVMRLPESSPNWCAPRAKRLAQFNGWAPDFFLQRPAPLPADLDTQLQSSSLLAF